MNNHQRESQYEHQRREQQQFATPYIYIYIICLFGNLPNLTLTTCYNI